MLPFALSTPQSGGGQPSADVRAHLASWRRRQRILLVEDDHEMRRLLATALRRDGYGVVECANGDDALDWLGPGVLEGAVERVPAAIITDVRLPYFSGLEILAGVGCAPVKIPVILITGFPDEATYREAFALGARCVLAKPFSLADLRGALFSVLRPEPPLRGGPAAR